MPKVSIIIPCYNQGHFLDEAVESVLKQTFQDFEIIVVNDGSTDGATIKFLEAYNKPNTRVIHTSNQGLASARNNGIGVASGKYILPLDADDRIGSTYIEKAVAALDANERVGIVYCRAELFGEMAGEWELPAYSFPDFLLKNVIFCSSFFRKADWEQTGGYNPNMIYGWEDFDYWLSLIELGREVFHIPETLFFYRRQAGSMLHSMSREQYLYSYAQLFRNHQQLYADNIETVFNLISDLKEAVWQREAVIASMQNSKWWKLRMLAVRLKRLLGTTEAVTHEEKPLLSAFLGK